MMNDSPDLKQDLQLGALLEKFKRFDKAECIYRSIIEQHPTDFRAYFNCAQILASDELRLAEAYTLFAKVIELDESVIETYGSIAAVLIKQHRPREAVYYCETGLGKNPQNRTCLYNLNVSLRQLNSIYAAICRSWKALISIDPLVIHNTERESSIAQVPAQNRVAPTSIGTTVVCVKWGKKYGANYVNNLYHALMRHQPSDERCRTNKMVCFTDDTTGIDPAVVCEPFAVSTAKWHGWWLKAQVFARHPQLTGWLLYIDLDTVISSPLDFLAPLLHAQDKSEDNQVPPETLFNGPNNEILRNQSAKFYTLAAEHFQNEGMIHICYLSIWPVHFFLT